MVKHDRCHNFKMSPRISLILLQSILIILLLDDPEPLRELNFTYTYYKQYSSFNLGIVCPMTGP